MALESVERHPLRPCDSWLASVAVTDNLHKEETPLAPSVVCLATPASFYSLSGVVIGVLKISGQVQLFNSSGSFCRCRKALYFGNLGVVLFPVFNIFCFT